MWFTQYAKYSLRTCIFFLFPKAQLNNSNRHETGDPKKVRKNRTVCLDRMTIDLGKVHRPTCSLRNYDLFLGPYCGDKSIKSSIQQIMKATWNTQHKTSCKCRQRYVPCSTNLMQDLFLALFTRSLISLVFYFL